MSGADAAARPPGPPGAAPSIADALLGVEVVWVRRGEEPPDHAWRFGVRWLRPRPRSAALAYLESPGAFRGPAVDDRRPAVALFVFPGLDDVVALAMWAWERGGRGRPGGAGWEAVAHYADNVRQGLLPETLPPTRLPQSVYRAIAEARLKGDRSGFVEPALWLVELLVARVAEGRSLLHDDLVSDEPFLVEYLDLLREDEARYREDRDRGLRFRARIPADAALGRETVLPLLAVSSPRATHFRVWAQRDPEAPGGPGWPLVVVQRRPIEPGLTDVQVTARPSARVTVSFLAASLTSAERAVAGPDAEPWYAGADYEERMVASPEEGTRLTLRQVLDAISGPLALRRLWPRWVVPSAAAALLLAAALGAALLARPTIFGLGRGQEEGDAGGTSGEERIRAERAAASRAAFASRRDRALLVATERFSDPGWRPLRYPVRQARALGAALERRGFAVTLLENPTHDQVTAALARTHAEAWGPYDQLVVYFAGHGSVDERLRTGRLVLADSRREGGFLSLADLRQTLVEHAARHVLLVLDACQAGRVRERPLASEVALDPRSDLQGAELAYRGAPGDAPEIDEATAIEKLAVPSRRYMTAVDRDATPDESRFSAGLIALLESGAGYLTDLSLAARLEGIRPAPQYGRFAGDDETGGIVFGRPAVRGLP